MQLDINLATRTYIDTRKVNLVFAVVLVLLGLLLAYHVRTAASMYGETQKLRLQIADLERKFGLAGGGVTEKAYSETLASIDEANRIIERKALNWLALLDLLEGTVPDGIGITGVTPMLKDNRLMLAGEAAAFRNIRKFLENLEADDHFTDVYLLSQDVRSPGEPVAFTISCTINLKAL